ncbi:MAG: hypothetical protein J0I20_14130 [Chloroflexi bacterium]|nr:hypothetical protein [Chloroflexota bacterium]OJV92734.1 MAG: hypothetical protein BGO39_29615 [Chloroflexi bacterium 54-19]
MSEEMDRESIIKAVDEILRTHNLPVDKEDYEWMVNNYPKIREMVGKLRIPEARYVSPALVFSPL